MTPEQETLETVLADTFREVSTAARLADMAGLDVVQVDRTGSVADVWHSIISMAVQDGLALGQGVAQGAQLTQMPQGGWCWVVREAQPEG